MEIGEALIDNTQQGGSRDAGVRLLFKIRGAGGVDLRLGYLGGHQPHGKGPGGGGGSGTVGNAVDWAAPAAET